MKKAAPFILIFTLTLGLFWAKRLISDNEPVVDYVGNNKVINVEEDDVEMNRAMEKARESLPHFFERYANQQPGDDLFALKVKISAPHGDEYFWLNQLEITDSSYTGTINNTPNIVSCVREGQRYDFSHDAIKDWTYYENGTMKGNLTLYVLLDRVSEKEANLIRQQLGI